jgi:hypothetical protein
LPSEPTFADSNPAENEAIQIRNTTSFLGEVKPSVSCLKVLRHVKDPFRYKKEISRRQISATSRQVSSASLLGVCWLLPKSCGE